VTQAPSAVLSTRPDGREDELVERLQRMGYRVHAVPTVAIEGIEPNPSLDEALARLESYDWLVVTSAAGVRAILPRILASSAAAGRRWAAAGAATAAALAAGGLSADAVPDSMDPASLAGAMEAVAPLAGRRLLLLRASAASDELPAGLRAAGALVEEVVAYRTVIAPPASGQALRDALDDPALGVIAVASGSAVRGLVELAGDRLDQARRTPLASIGPATSAVGRSLGFTVAAEARSNRAGALADAVRAAMEGVGSEH
jgi:uroporphyrinogen III methyltransferase/synthase